MDLAGACDEAGEELHCEDEDYDRLNVEEGRPWIGSEGRERLHTECHSREDDEEHDEHGPHEGLQWRREKRRDTEREKEQQDRRNKSTGSVFLLQSVDRTVETARDR